MPEKNNGDGRLPAHIEDQVSAAELKALQHPIRRQLLRALESSDGSLGASDLTKTVPCSLATAAYHLQVLVQSGLVEAVASVPSQGRTTRLFSFSVEAESPVHAALEVTAESDLQHLQPAS